MISVCLKRVSKVAGFLRVLRFPPTGNVYKFDSSNAQLCRYTFTSVTALEQCFHLDSTKPNKFSSVIYYLPVVSLDQQGMNTLELIDLSNLNTDDLCVQ